MLYPIAGVSPTPLFSAETNAIATVAIKQDNAAAILDHQKSNMEVEADLPKSPDPSRVLVLESDDSLSHAPMDSFTELTEEMIKVCQKTDELTNIE